MERLTHWRVNGIKAGHWSPAKKEELIQRLAAYEDIRLTPEEIMELKKGSQKGGVREDMTVRIVIARNLIASSPHGARSPGKSWPGLTNHYIIAIG